MAYVLLQTIALAPRDTLAKIALSQSASLSLPTIREYAATETVYAQLLIPACAPRHQPTLPCTQERNARLQSALASWQTIQLFAVEEEAARVITSANAMVAMAVCNASSVCQTTTGQPVTSFAMLPLHAMDRATAIQLMDHAPASIVQQRDSTTAQQTALRANPVTTDKSVSLHWTERSSCLELQIE